MHCACASRRLFALVLALAAVTVGDNAFADIYDAAVAHPGRSAKDLERDAADRPAEVLRAAGIRRGMRVADFFAADGYYSELLSYIVGPTGQVLLINNPPYDRFARNAWRERIDRHHLTNVEHLGVDPAAMDLPEGSLDAVIMIKVYHDLYWVAPEDGWPKIDASRVLDQLARALKPGGTLLVVDHAARPGSGSSGAGTLHRIDEAFMRKDFESHGFVFVRRSDALRRADDAHDHVSYKEPMLGRTDRFVYVFRKGGH